MKVMMGRAALTVDEDEEDARDTETKDDIVMPRGEEEVGEDEEEDDGDPGSEEVQMTTGCVSRRIM